jgi:hypothetical protein
LIRTFLFIWGPTGVPDLFKHFGRRAVGKMALNSRVDRIKSYWHRRLEHAFDPAV